MTMSQTTNNLINNLRIYLIYKDKVIEDGSNIEHVPLELIDEELCKLAVLSTKKNIMPIKYIPDQFKTKEICVLSIIQNPYSIVYLPKKYTTTKLCKYVLEKCPDILEKLSQSNLQIFKTNYDLCNKLRLQNYL
jgi:hypothetical protein